MHTTTARDIRKVTGWDLDGTAAENGWQSVGVGPVGRHRDSDSLDNSNWDVITADLLDRFPEAFEVHYFRHWAVGWAEELAYDSSRPAVCRYVQRWTDALQDYPVANEDHYSEREWNDNHPANDESCYSDDPDCGCGRTEQ